MKPFILLTLTSGIAILCLGWVMGNFEFSSPLFAFLVNWLVMSWVAISGQIVPFPLPPEAYYAEKPFEKAGWVYEIVGVRIFKSIVRRPPFTLLSPTLKIPAEKTTSSLQGLQKEMKKAEAGHLFVFFLVLTPALYALLTAQYLGGIWLLFFNVLFNGYPVMLQRYNRIKLQELIAFQ